jgi:hypothetical protein
MKTTFWIGLAVLILGIGLLVFPIPQTHHEGLRVGSVSLGIETHDNEMVPPYVAGLVVLCGAGIMLAQRVRA